MGSPGSFRQPSRKASPAALTAAVAAYEDFALTALYAATAACGSLVIALALLEGRVRSAEAFAAYQLDERFQIDAWGEDKEQAERRAALSAEIAAAARFMALLRNWSRLRVAKADAVVRL